MEGCEVKTERQLCERLEEITAKIETLAGQCGDEPSEQQKAEALSLLASVGVLAWVLDCEDQMRPVLCGLRLAALSEEARKKATKV
jgi:hypothetical protein